MATVLLQLQVSREDRARLEAYASVVRRPLDEVAGELLHRGLVDAVGIAEEPAR